MASNKKEIALDESKGGHSAKKFTCPGCNHKKKFVKYFNFTDGEYLPAEFGRCDREENCGYFEQPYEILKEQQIATAPDRPQHYKNNPKYTPQPKPEKIIKTVEKEIALLSLQFYESNNFCTWLNSILPPDQVATAIKRFYIGTGKAGATIFWQIDRFMRIRTATRIIYNPDDGKRFRDIYPTRLFTNDAGFSSCLFGEHQLFEVGEKHTIAIVESEKTAILCSIYLPTLQNESVLWMACSSVNGLTEDKIKCLAGKNIILVPDFSFHARATWGQVPMRKIDHVSDSGRKTKIPHPDGDLIEDYISYAEKLRAIKCSVRFFDPAPDVWDSSDIGDLVQTYEAPKPPKPTIKKPDFNSLVVPNAKNIAQNAPIVPNLEENGLSLLTHANESFPFRIVQKSTEDVQALIEPALFTQKLHKFLNQPLVRILINNLDICEGEFTPYGTRQQ